MKLRFKIPQSNFLNGLKEEQNYNNKKM